MDNFRVQIRSMEFPGWVSQFREWIARSVGKDEYVGKVSPGLYLVSVRGTTLPRFYALPVSPSLLDHIRQAASNPEDNEALYHLTCTGCHDSV